MRELLIDNPICVSEDIKKKQIFMSKYRRMMDNFVL